MALSAEEAEQYDRQIRLWGLDAQKRLRNAKVLVVGMNGLSAEVAKNLVLTGINTLTIIDSDIQGPEDTGNRFLCLQEGENRSLSAVNRLQILNPNVTITADESDINDKQDEFFMNFDLVCVTSGSLNTMMFVNDVCRKHSIKYMSGHVWGYYGYFFTDLQDHTYAIDVPKHKMGLVDVDKPNEFNNNGDTTITEKKTMQFCSLRDSWGIKWNHKPVKYFKRTPPTIFIIKILQNFYDKMGRAPQLSSLNEDQLLLKQTRDQILAEEEMSPNLITDEFINHCFSDLSPVCAIVGGVLAQEVIKALSAKDAPLFNAFLYDGVHGSGIVEPLLP